MLLPIITSKTNHRELQHIHRIHKISSVTKIIITEGSPTPHEMNQQFCPTSRHDYSQHKHGVFWVTFALRNNSSFLFFFFFLPRSIAVIII
jgi:hypothetical protein